MSSADISVRILGDAAPLTDTLDHARLGCIRRELDALPTAERTRTVSRLLSRYTP